jgi:hypothetical protein
VRLITQLHLVLKGEYSYTFSPPGCLYDVKRNSFFFLLVVNRGVVTVVFVQLSLCLMKHRAMKAYGE